MRSIRPLFLVPVLCALCSLQSAQISPTQPTDLSASHRSGQTFLTWTASVGTTVLTYRIYRHDSPINPPTFAMAAMVHEVTRDSNRFYADRHYLPSTNTWKARYVDRYVLTDLGPELLDTQEFLVWTLAEDDFGGASSGNGFYAVTSVDDLGSENTTDFLAGNVLGPVAESIDAPQPVLTKVLLSGRCT